MHLTNCVTLFCIEISVTEEVLDSLKHSEQTLGVKLSELEARERRVDEELEELELVSWNEKLEMETARCTQLEAEAEALRSSTAWCEMEVDQWQPRLDHITATTETLKTNSQQMRADETRLKEQVAIS